MQKHILVFVLCLIQPNGVRHILVLVICLVRADGVGVDCSDWSLVVIEELPRFELSSICVHNCRCESESCSSSNTNRKLA